MNIGLARTIYIRCIYGIFGREITKYTVIYGVYIRFWPTLNTWYGLEPCSFRKRRIGRFSEVQLETELVSSEDMEHGWNTATTPRGRLSVYVLQAEAELSSYHKPAQMNRLSACLISGTYVICNMCP
jgi:hypothetical protein